MAVAAAALAVVLGACGGGSDGDGAQGDAGPAATTARVVAKDLEFKPSKVRLLVGGTVTWSFEDGSTPHNVVASDKSYTSDNKTSGTFAHTYDKPGVYKYVCTIHPAMKGSVTVVNDTGTP